MVDCSLVGIIYVSTPFTLERTTVFSLSRRGHSSTVSPLDLLYTRTRYAKGYIILLVLGETMPLCSSMNRFAGLPPTCIDRPSRINLMKSLPCSQRRGAPDMVDTTNLKPPA